MRCSGFDGNIFWASEVTLEVDNFEVLDIEVEEIGFLLVDKRKLLPDFDARVEFPHLLVVQLHGFNIIFISFRSWLLFLYTPGYDILILPGWSHRHLSVRFSLLLELQFGVTVQKGHFGVSQFNRFQSIGFLPLLKQPLLFIPCFLPVFSHPFCDVKSINNRQPIGSNLKILFLSFVHTAVNDGFVEHIDGFKSWRFIWVFGDKWVFQCNCLWIVF